VQDMVWLLGYVGWEGVEEGVSLAVDLCAGDANVVFGYMRAAGG